MADPKSHRDPTNTEVVELDADSHEERDLDFNMPEKADAEENNIKPTRKDVEIGELGEDSPYPEVRASVPPIDEDIPVNTFRAWFLGIISTVILTALNQFFQLHTPPIFLSSYLPILLTLPCGHFMARVLPTTTYNILGWKFTLNPGPFNRKEHTITGIMATLATAFDNGSLASDVWVGFEKFLDIPISVGYKFLFLLTTQALSFGMVGILHQFLVEPALCVWPAALPTCTLLHSFHDKKFQDKVANGWKVNRMRFFWIVFWCMVVYQIIPGYLFTGLATFAWITWIKPNNVTLNQVFGATTGMDLLPISFDWNQITGYLSSPLLVPSWALINVLGGSIFFLWVVSPILHWKNVWDGMYMSFSSSSTYDNTGNSYNTSRVMNADYSLNEEAYHQYSPVYLSTTSILSYGLGFASVTSILVHTALYHRDTIWQGMKRTIGRNATEEEPDIHLKLMRKYKNVPQWWYITVLLIMFGLSVAFMYVYDTGLPWYGLILSMAVNFVLLVPVGIMQAICNVSLSTAVISAIIAGFIWPGKMMNNVVFKLYTLTSNSQGLGYVRDMKIGHYMKIPPRTTFIAQCVGILVSWLTQVAVNIWALGNVENICTDESDFGCPLASGYATNAIFWGLIGPKKLFASGSMYSSMLWFFLIGAILPIIVFLLERRYPNTFLRHVHVPAIFASTASIPPATASNYIAWGIIGLIFNSYIKRKFRDWWVKYNYILSAALDAGLAVTTFLVFFCLTYPGVTLNWYGNTIASVTADGLGTPLKTVAEGEHFGLDTWI
ncbi:MAG: hypothetical protein M1834_005230 [Cirrosporium novae-zelandiae]|nr:MAG: hypothetical protein M1834_005230 [Cirrosporium novae-zelandiae]